LGISLAVQTGQERGIKNTFMAVLFSFCCRKKRRWSAMAITGGNWPKGVAQIASNAKHFK